MPLNRPTQDELLEAVAEYLSQPVVDAAADRFYRRVACNAVELVRREQALQSDFQQSERQHLQLLLNATSDELAELNQRLNAAIASGELALTPALTKALLAIAELKLGIDNPRYAL
ncbi:MAG: DUF6285 domain-containing protein [Pseudomonadota bacterium]|nr:DUF6285 domain-containing protein [Pseudomonadota bacterium]